jgi:hypothetical protein
MVVAGRERAPQQKGSDQRDQHAAGGLELRRPTAISKHFADDREAEQHEDEGKSDMGEGKDSAVGEAIDWARRLAEMIGDEDRLAVAWHQRMHRAEQNCCGQGEEDGACVSARDIAKALAHAAIEPVLNGNQSLHGASVIRCRRSRGFVAASGQTSFNLDGHMTEAR